MIFGFFFPFLFPAFNYRTLVESGIFFVGLLGKVGGFQNDVA